MPLLQNEHTVCKRKGFAQIMSDKEHCGLKLLVDAAKKDKRNSVRSFGSALENGSSSSNMDGFLISARAMAIL